MDISQMAMLLTVCVCDVPNPKYFKMKKQACVSYPVQNKIVVQIRLKKGQMCMKLSLSTYLLEKMICGQK